MNNKKIPTTLGTIVIVIFAITAGMFVWQHEKNMPADSSQSQVGAKKIAQSNKQSENKKVDQSNLQTYRNDKLGFEFQYPTTWTFDEKTLRFNPNYPKNCGPNIDSTIKEPMCLDGIVFTIDQNSGKLSLDKLFEKNGWKKGQDYSDIREFKIGDVTAYRVTLTSAYDGSNGDALYVPLRDGSFLILQESYLVDDEKSVFDQMLSTFKFTDQNYIEVKELGFRLPVDATMVNEVTYKMSKPTGVDVAFAEFSSKTGGCDGGSVSRISGTPVSQKEEPEFYKAHILDTKQFNGFFLYYGSPQAVSCDPVKYADMQKKIMQAVSDGVKNASLIGK